MRSKLALILMILPLAVLNCMPDNPAPSVATTESEITSCDNNGACAPNIEDCGTCPGDCPCPGGFVCSNRQCVPICGDNSCAPGAEDCGTCPIDCPCPGGTFCSNRQCVSDPCNGDPCCGDPCCGDICCRRPHLCCPVMNANGQTELTICQ
jgi:hypothetical protein